MIPVPTLHVIADLDAAEHPQFERVLDQLSSQRSSAIHLRDRDAAGRTLATLATRIREAGVTCIINDRVDVALVSNADGVHLPAEGLPMQSARSIIGDKLIGRSTHSSSEARSALKGGADYSFLGPIWATPSHPGKTALGVDSLEDRSAPVIAIGGVTPSRVSACLDAGFHGVAIIGAVWKARDPADAIRTLQVLLEQ